MSLLYIESFDWISTSITGPNLETVLERKYDNVNITSGTDATIVTGRRGGSALKGGSSTGQLIRTQVLRDTTVDKKFICGLAVKTPAIFLSNSVFISVMSGGASQLVLRIELSGALTVRRSSTFLETGPPIFQVNRWYYMEVKAVISTTAGSVEIKLDGTTVWTSATNLNTRADTNTFWDGLKINIGGMGNGQIVDDIYICDDNGTVNNNFLGDTSVEHINPNAIGDDSVWTPSSAVDHYTLVDDGTARTTPVDETDYVSSGTTGQKDLFNYESLATGPGLGDATLIHGVQVNTWARITEIQPSDLLAKTKTGTTEANVTKTIRHDDVEQFMEFGVFELDADTAAAWTVSGINGAQFGIETGAI